MHFLFTLEINQNKNSYLNIAFETLEVKFLGSNFQIAHSINFLKYNYLSIGKE